MNNSLTLLSDRRELLRKQKKKRILYERRRTEVDKHFSESDDEERAMKEIAAFEISRQWIKVGFEWNYLREYHWEDHKGC